MSDKPQARARVTMTVEITVDDTWGGDCSIAQVERQARASAENALRQGLIIHGTTLSGSMAHHEGVIVGKPSVDVILVRR